MRLRCPRCRKAVFRHQIAAPDSVVTHPGYPTIPPDPVTLNRADPPDAVLADENVIPLGVLHGDTISDRRWRICTCRRCPYPRMRGDGARRLESGCHQADHARAPAFRHLARPHHARRGRPGMRIFARFLEFPGWRTRAMRAANRGRAEAPQERLGIAPPYQGCRDGLGIAFGGLKPDDQDRLEVAGFR